MCRFFTSIHSQYVGGGRKKPLKQSNSNRQHSLEKKLEMMRITGTRNEFQPNNTKRKKNYFINEWNCSWFVSFFFVLSVAFFLVYLKCQYLSHLLTQCVLCAIADEFRFNKLCMNCICIWIVYMRACWFLRFYVEPTRLIIDKYEFEAKWRKKCLFTLNKHKSIHSNLMYLCLVALSHQYPVCKCFARFFSVLVFNQLNKLDIFI